MKELRRELHKIPEIGFNEFKTKDFILNYFKDKEVNIINIGETGLGIYFNVNKEKTICYRAELDALPIDEENETEYKSKHLGYMHACGHDGHMAILLSLIDDILNKSIIPNYNILFLFQPSEEINGGAESVIKSKILKECKVDEIYALHIWPNLPQGEIYTRYNELLAKATEFDITVEGRSAHVGDLLKGKDALDVGVKLIYQIKNEISSIDNCIVHFGLIESGKQRNIVSNIFITKGTIRTFDDKVFSKIIDIINRNVNYFSQTYDMEINLKINSSMCPLINDNELVKKTFKYGVKLLKYPYYQGEDFSLYLKEIRGVYFLLGAGNVSPLHSSTFDFDESILNKGKELFIKLITF